MVGCGDEVGYVSEHSSRSLRRIPRRAHFDGRVAGEEDEDQLRDEVDDAVVVARRGREEEDGVRAAPRMRPRGCAGRPLGEGRLRAELRVHGARAYAVRVEEGPQGAPGLDGVRTQ